ncbi:MAG TPA: GntR family transcriptional regulator [Steroidobacteraceae bacterium]|nr:GntR family transcriptional regulator [Steroidobacteraceae bacterium]
MKPPKVDLRVVLDPQNSLSLQQQLRQRLIDAMSHGVLRPGRRLPSSRRLARQIGVSRNTVILAYDALLAEGHLFSRPRSGLFVAPGLQNERVTTGRHGLRQGSSEAAAAPDPPEEADFRPPPNWQQYPYPFLDGCVEPDLLAVDGWREALRLAFSKQDVLRWASAAADADDLQFLDELRGKVLPAWGVDAAPDAVLGAVSVQQALHLVLDSLLERHAPVLLDVGVDQDLQRRLVERHATVGALEWDGNSARLAAELPREALVVVGSRRSLGGSLTSRERAEALLRAAEASRAVIVECVPGFDLRDPARNAWSLRSLDGGERVIAVGALSAVGSLGTPPGIIHGNARQLLRIRATRRRLGSEFPFGLQRAWAYYIALGHYAGACARASEKLQERRTALRDALNHYLHRFVTIRTRPASSAYWIHATAQLDPGQLARRAAAVGVLIEPVAPFGESAHFCMGVTSLRTERIREGVEKLARLIRTDPLLGSRRIQQEGAHVLKGAALRRALSGATLLYNTAYGEPCTLELRPDGRLIGRAGYSDEDQDTGRWWIEGDRWFRQWRHWAYGESVGYWIGVDNDQIRWFNAEGLLVDTAVIARRRRSKA